jgi:hypothetical protein
MRQVIPKDSPTARAMRRDSPFDEGAISGVDTGAWYDGSSVRAVLVELEERAARSSLRKMLLMDTQSGKVHKSV